MTSPTAKEGPVDVISMTMSGIWLVFLVYPVSGLLTRPAADRAVGFALMGLFVIGYLAMLRRLGLHVPENRHWLQVVIFAGLVAVAVASVPVLAAAAMGYVPFLTAAAVWGLWTPVNRWVGVATLAVALLVALAYGVTSDSVSVLLAGVLILVVGWLVTWMIDKGMADEARERRLLVVEERNRIASDVHDLVVEDDGDGLTGTPHDGNGLRGMHERVAAAGGELGVGHGELGGVKVEVAW